MKSNLQKAEVKNDILNLYFSGDLNSPAFKVAFRYGSFLNKMNHIYYDNHLTTAFTNIQYLVTVEIKNKHRLYKFKSKEHKFSFFDYDYENKLIIN